MLSSWSSRVMGPGGAAKSGGADPASSHLDAFLTTLATYPFLHMSAAAPGQSSPDDKRHQPRLPSSSPLRQAATGSQQLPQRPQVSPASRGGAGRRSLADYAEGRALLALERWCAEPALASLQSSLLFKLRIYLLVYLSWRGEDQQHLALAQGAPELPREEQQQLQLAMALGDAPAGGAPPTGGEGVAAVHVVRAPPHERGGEGEVLGFSNVDYATLGNSIPEPVHQWLQWAAHYLIRLLDVQLGGAMPPPLSIDTVVQAVESGQVLPGLDEAQGPEAADPIARVAHAVAPNVQAVTRELRRQVRLARSRSTLEWLNVLLGGVRMWLTGIAVAFYLLATGLRILGNGLSALGGLVAFTVVFSIAISVLSAATFLAASAADGTGTALEYMARFTDLAKRGASRARGYGIATGFGKLGPRTLGPASFEELEQVFAQQLVVAAFGRRGGGGGGGAGAMGLRSRPDVPRLAGNRLLITCYDAGLVDSQGALLPHTSVEDVLARFDPDGFFGHAGSLTRKAGAVLLLRLLAWKHVAAITAPCLPGEPEQALRYVFVAGLPGCGASTLYRALTGLPQAYQAQAGAAVGEMRPVLQHASSFALLCPPAARGGVAQGGQAFAAAGSWVTNPRHGVVSCAVVVVSVEVQPQHVGGLEPSGGGGGASGASGPASPASAAAAGVPVLQALEVLWRVLAVRRPVLVAVNKAAKLQLGQRSQGEQVLAAERVVGLWKGVLREEAHRRGLEAEHMTVVLTELVDVPPMMAAGLPHVREWLAQALAEAPQQRVVV